MPILNSPHMEAKLCLRDAGRKTDRWVILSKSGGDELGTVSWYGPWRQYVFEPFEGCVFNCGCLESIENFLRAANVEQKIASLVAERSKP